MDVLNLKLQRQKCTRIEAQLQGLTLYWSQKECPQGHTGWRYAANNSCRRCSVNRTGVPKVESNYQPNESLTNARRSVEDAREMRRIDAEINGW